MALPAKIPHRLPNLALCGGAVEGLLQFVGVVGDFVALRAQRPHHGAGFRALEDLGHPCHHGSQLLGSVAQPV